jgi:hypothetical protein
MCRLHCLLYHTQQVDIEGFQVRLVLQLGGEGFQGLSSVVLPSLEATVYEGLDAPTERVEQGGDHQVKHILGAVAHAARAAELIAGDDRDVGAEHIEQARQRATPAVVEVLKRYPAAPPGGGRAGELIRDLDEALRGRS